MKSRLKILVIAEAANPEWVSVPLVGWSMAYALRRVADVHIVTQIRNRGAIARAGLVEEIDFTTIDTERVSAPAYKLAQMLRGGKGKGWTLVAAVSAFVYPYFERLVWRRFGKAIKAGQFDVVHRVTPLSPTRSSSLAGRCREAGIPFVIGPLNGGLPWPKGFDSDRRKEREWLSYVRSAYKILPGRNATLKAASVIVAGSRHTAAELPRQYRSRIVYMPENGIDPRRFVMDVRPPLTELIGLCFIGRLVPYKGPDIALQASIPLLKGGRAHFHVIGDGPMRAELEALVADAGIRDSVTFHGWVEHERIQDVAKRAQIFVFPSFREFGGGAVLEAMALGLFPIVVDYGGPGELVALAGGVAVPMNNRARIVEEIKRELASIVADPERLMRVSEEARAWVYSRLTWSAKADAMLDIYNYALDPNGPLPVPY